MCYESITLFFSFENNIWFFIDLWLNNFVINKFYINSSAAFLLRKKSHNIKLSILKGTIQ